MQNAPRAAREKEDEVNEEPGGAGRETGERQGSLKPPKNGNPKPQPPNPNNRHEHLRRGAYKVRGAEALAERSKGSERGRGRSQRRTWRGSLNPLKAGAPNPNPQTRTTGTQHFRRGAHKVRGAGALAERSKGSERGRGRSQRRTWRAQARKKRDAGQPQAPTPIPNNRHATLKEGAYKVRGAGALAERSARSRRRTWRGQWRGASKRTKSTKNLAGRRVGKGKEGRTAT